MTIELTVGNKWQRRNAQQIAKNNDTLVAVHSSEGPHIGYVSYKGIFFKNYSSITKTLLTHIGNGQSVEKRKSLMDCIKSCRADKL